MKKNIGTLDRNIRIAIGVVLLVVGLFAQLATGWRVGVFVLAAVALGTAFVNF